MPRPLFSRIMLAGVGAALVAASTSAAQERGTLTGVVRDSAGTPIRDADIAVVALRMLTRTDGDGRFRLAKLPPGEIVVSIRRIGYEPTTVPRLVAPGTVDSVIVEIARLTTLEGIQISERAMRQRFWIEEFYRRRTRGVGTYFTREEIEQKRASRPSEILRTTPGIRLVRLRGGQGVRFMSSSVMRRDCMPMIWIDGQQAPGMEIDDLPLSTIEGLELYHGPSTTPMQFSQGSMTTCGTIVVWSRIPGT
ncbi:MAG TPA: carboxypeptidase regulatory-like domain-containing protein [Gemmatimonadaceae bacterium]|jgi:hypothetical protein